MKLGLLILILISALNFEQASASGSKNNVCKHFADYIFIDTSPNCWYNPDLDSDIFEIFARKGIPYESYNVESEDGYILTLFRLPRSNPKGIAFLAHPMSQTPIMWFNDGDKSLGFVLYEEGFDVWLPNSRGSYYSSEHKTLSQQDYAYWNFSFHEMGIYDLPAELDLVKSVTGRSDIYFIGYSLSAGAAFAYASLLPDHARSSLKLIIAMAPVIYADFSMVSEQNYKRIQNHYDRWQMGSFMQSFDLTQIVTRLTCDVHQLKFFCPLLLIQDLKGLTNLDPSKTSFAFRKFVTRMPVKVMWHYHQINESRRFQEFDYGETGNLISYNRTKPPPYPVKNIKVPVFFVLGGKDRSVAVKNVNKFYGELPPEIKTHRKLVIPDFNHYDFIFGRQFKEKVVDPILDVMKNESKAHHDTTMIK